MTPTPVEVVVAKITTSPELQAQNQPTEALNLEAGNTLVLKAIYHLGDLPQFEESTTLRFAATTGGADPPPAILQARDRPMLSDERWGYLAQRLVFQNPGLYEVSFEATIDQHRRRWDDASFADRVQGSAAGTVQVRVT